MKKQSEQQVKPLYRSEEYWKKTKEERMKESIARQMKAKEYEREWLISH